MVQGDDKKVRKLMCCGIIKGLVEDLERERDLDVLGVEYLR